MECIWTSPNLETKSSWRIYIYTYIYTHKKDTCKLWWFWVERNQLPIHNFSCWNAPKKGCILLYFIWYLDTPVQLRFFSRKKRFIPKSRRNFVNRRKEKQGSCKCQNWKSVSWHWGPWSEEVNTDSAWKILINNARFHIVYWPYNFLDFARCVSSICAEYCMFSTPIGQVTNSRTNELAKTLHQTTFTSWK